MTGGGRNLRITGPTPLPPATLDALRRPMVSHRSEEFRSLLSGVVRSLRPAFGTAEAAILPFTASGTGGLEAAILNTVAPGERVLSIRCGHFGERFAEIAAHYGLEVVALETPWGRATDPEALRRWLRTAPVARAALLTHNETSTGVLEPVGEVAAVLRRERPEMLLLVDGVSSVGAVEVEMDSRGLDVVVTASQKALMAPPGLALVAAGPRALEAAARHPARPYYLDFARMRAATEEGTTTYTPAISVVFALAASLERLGSQGLPRVFEHHRRLASRCREVLAAVGLRPFADPLHASPTVTAMLTPAGVSASWLRRRLEEEASVFVSQGRGAFKDSVIRIGHLGFVDGDDVEGLLGAFRAVLREEVATG